MSGKEEVSRYSGRGVSAQKEDVHKATENLEKGLFPNAFCKIYPDYLTGDEQWCSLVHADGTGTKSALAYLYWKETGDLSIWKDLALDCIFMNLDDLLCVGATGPYLFSSIINRNKHLIPSEVLAAIIEGTAGCFENLRKFGVEIHLMGGETADMGDVVRTVTVDGTMTCRMKRSEVIDNANIQPGDVIVGLASFGQAVYENQYNSGMGSNGLTSARHDVFSKVYAARYPEVWDPNTPQELVFSGSRLLTDSFEDAPLNCGRLVLSPTRTYAPLLLSLFKTLRKQIHGLVHCSGGGQTKALHYVNNLHIVKDNLFEPPHVFRLIQQESETGWREMYQVFNMGHRLEVYLPEEFANQVIGLAQSFGIDAAVIGRCEAFNGKKLTIESTFGQFEY